MGWTLLGRPPLFQTPYFLFSPFATHVQDCELFLHLRAAEPPKISRSATIFLRIFVGQWGRRKKTGPHFALARQKPTYLPRPRRTLGILCPRNELQVRVVITLCVGVVLRRGCFRRLSLSEAEGNVATTDRSSARHATMIIVHHHPNGPSPPKKLQPAYG